MANNINITVSKVSATPTSNGNYIHTLKTEGGEIAILGGTKKSFGATYFIALDFQAPVGTKDTLDLDNFDIIERPFEVVDDNTQEVTTLMLKWLHVRKAS